MLHFLIVTPDVVLMMFSLTGTTGSGSKVVQGRQLPSAPPKKKKKIYIYIYLVPLEKPIKTYLILPKQVLPCPN